jgi:CRP/FNR family transcriptional regulator, cyclic AMP receptor protein
VKITGNHNGTEPLLGIRIGGDLVGEMAAISGEPRAASVATGSRTTARMIAGDQLTNFLEHHREVDRQVTVMEMRRLRWANQLRVSYAADDATTRVVQVLSALTELYGQETGKGRNLGARLTQREIAELAGTGVATVEKTLADLRRRGILQKDSREVLVTDIDGLRAELTREDPM